MGNRKAVRILLLGDPGVGKTSLILSLVSEEFPDNVPAKAEEITIPPDVTPEKVPTHIVDYSEREQTREQMKIEIKAADVVCIVYSVEEEDTLDMVTQHWLPTIRSTLGEQHCTPVLLVGNKIDMVDYSTMEIVMQTMMDYPEIETCVECSAKSLKNISEMFYYAQKAVLHPTNPLYALEERDLTPKCKKALSRIFKICDEDADNVLNDDELNLFQRRCFNAPLNEQSIEELKSVIQMNISDGICNNCMTEKGFLFLHKLFIQRGRHETTWTVLRKFGYDHNVQLSSEYLFPSIKIPVGCTTELNHSGYMFLTSLFEKYDKDKDLALSPQEQVNYFSTCPIMPWGPDVFHSVLTNQNGWITLEGYLAQWTLWTLLDVKKTTEYLAYLGYPVLHGQSQSNLITVTREKTIDLQKRQTMRNVYQCNVIGHKGVGKTTFCQGLLSKKLKETDELQDASLSRHVCRTVPVYGQEKYLVLHDVDIHGYSDVLRPADVTCDVACLVYDASRPESFEFVARIYLKYFCESQIPVLFVASKNDLQAVRQEYIMQPIKFCRAYHLPPPHTFSSIDVGISQDLYTKLATMAAYPRFQAAWMLFYRARHLKHLSAVVREHSLWLKAGLGIATAAAVTIILVKTLQ